MLVMMQVGAHSAAIDAVCRAAGEVGLASTVYNGSEPSVVHLAGDNIQDAYAAIAGLTGVERVVVAESTERPVTSNLRISGIRPLVPPSILQEELPLPTHGAWVVHRARQEVSDILKGVDDRLIVVVGPCSIHDPEAALEYACELAVVSANLSSDLRIVMRVYFEKPRTTVGWKGLINDPLLDGSFSVNEGLHIARKLLLDVIELGLPAGCEFLDPITPQFIADAVAWGAIGARTTESQVHRNLSSGLSMPIGFKNGTGGDIQVAIDAMHAAAYPHQFMSVTEQGVAAIVATRGNRDTHVILRGGSSGPNFDADSVQRALTRLSSNKLPARLMIDASHGNSSKDFRRQPIAAEAIAENVAGGEKGIVGVMLESFLVDGRQELTGTTPLTFGQSVTDACMGWEMTVPVLEQLAESVRSRRSAASNSSV
jgi:3-deoxy-7-phosphoheptulonate synthase